MKKIWIVAILALLILAACTPKAPPAEKQAVPVAEKAPVEEKAPEPITAPEVGRVAPARPLPSERQQPPAPIPTVAKLETNPALRDLLKRADEKISSLQYLYGGTATNNLFLDTYMVKGTKMRIHKYPANYYVREGYYDNIYFDLGATTGVGCCVEQARCKSANVDNTGKKFDVDVSTLNVPQTPYQWTKQIPANAQIVGPQTFNQRSVTFIKYTDSDGSEVQMLIDDTYGVPHRVLMTDKNGNVIKHQFNDMVFNTLKDGDLAAPCAK